MNKKPVQTNEDFINSLKNILCEENTQCKEVCPDKKKIINFAVKRNKDASTTFSRTSFKEIFTDCFDELAEVFKSYVATKNVDESCTCKLDRGIPARPHQPYKLNYLSVSNKSISEQQWNNVQNTLTQYSEQNIPQHNIAPVSVDVAIQLPYLGKKDQITECKESHNKCYFNIDTSTSIIRNLEDKDSIEALLTKNTRLCSAVKKLTSIRQKEKQNTPWRGFINELRRKHNQYGEMYPFCSCCNSEDRNIHSNEKLNTSSSYADLKKLVQEVYDDMPHTNHASARENTEFLRENDTLLDTGRYFGPNLTREYNVFHKSNREKPFCVDDYIEAEDTFGKRNVKKYNYNLHNKNMKEKVPFTKTDLREYDEKIENAKRKLNNTIVKCDKLRADIKPRRKPNHLINIETKIDHLIKSIDKFILEVNNHKNANVCKLEINKSNAGSRSESDALKDFEEALCGHFSTFALHKKNVHSQEYCPEKFKFIISNDINNDHNKYVRSSTNITSRLLSNQRSAETSTSLLAEPLSHGDDKSAISNKSKRQRDCYKHLVNIAINTDPLGLFALLKISSQSIKHLMSLMPTINYLPMLQYSDDKKTEDANFTCKVCGACFPSPAELSKHILGHSLGAVR